MDSHWIRPPGALAVFAAQPGLRNCELGPLESLLPPVLNQEMSLQFQYIFLYIHALTLAEIFLTKQNDLLDW